MMDKRTKTILQKHGPDFFKAIRAKRTTYTKHGGGFNNPEVQAKALATRKRNALKKKNNAAYHPRPNAFAKEQ